VRNGFRWETESLRPPARDTTRIEYERRQAEQAWRIAEAEQAAGRVYSARDWVERAHRFTPSDQNLAFTLATLRLGTGDAKGAYDLFTAIAARHVVREVLAGQVAAALALHKPQQAGEALAQALSAFMTDSVLAGLARTWQAVTGRPWCGVVADGKLFATSAHLVARLDGKKITLRANPNAAPHGPVWFLPPAARRAARLDLSENGVPLAGSPIDLAALRRLEGSVERVRNIVSGWAWHPGAPETDPQLTITAPGSEWGWQVTLTATDLTVTIPGSAPLTRGRGFSLKVPAGDIRVTGPDGTDLLGSPLRTPNAPKPAPKPAQSAIHPAASGGATIVIPAYRGEAATLACIASVLATIGPEDRVIVVDDASPEPGLVRALHALAAAGQITRIDSCAEAPGRNLGFPSAANAGLAAAGGTDVVLLNSDTLVSPGWLGRLRAAARAAPRIGTATPLSNDASIFTYPEPGTPAAMPGPSEAAALAAQAARANDGILVEVPTAHGFCMFIRADCLHETGLLREDVFGQGYGEENDFCERALALGWRHVAVPSVYVAHQGGGSFGAARMHLLNRNAGLLESLHPAYHGRVADFISADGLAAARRRFDEVRWRDAHAGAGEAILLITHGGAGGTKRVVRARAQAARDRGLRPIVLAADEGWVTVDAESGFPNLRYRLPADLDRLAAVLAAARPVAADLHHLLGHDAGITDLLARFALPTELWVHDWSWICPRLSFVTPEARFCGEPPARDCEPCCARGDPPAMGISAAGLRHRSLALLRSAARVVTATQDGAHRIARHFPGISAEIAPWEPPQLPTRAPIAAPAHAQTEWLTVCVVGAISIEKGYNVVLDCARDAASRGLHLRFHIVGYTVDDEPLLQTGQVSVTGPFAAGEAAALIRAAGADFAFLPSIWPETWCYALSDIWEAGLRAAVFDIGAPAERVRAKVGNGGWVLPLGLPPHAVNDALLRLQGVAGRS
jgi:GT2 family glycosyltransferase/glycosyltransferase involved in cell wall biosynthesis